MSSKKDDDIRHRELLAEFKEPIEKVCTQNLSTLIHDQFGFAILVETIKNMEDPSEIFEDIVDLVMNTEEDEKGVVNELVSSRTLKKNFSKSLNKGLT